MFHCSVSLQPPRPVSRWTATEVRLAERLALRVLHGVGDGDRIHVQEGEIARHWRRPLRPEEEIAFTTSLPEQAQIEPGSLRFGDPRRRPGASRRPRLEAWNAGGWK